MSPPTQEKSNRDSVELLAFIYTEDMKIFSVLLVGFMLMAVVKSIADHNLGNFMKFLQVMKLTEWSQRERIPREVFHAYLAEIQKTSTKDLTLEEKYQGRLYLL